MKILLNRYSNLTFRRFDLIQNKTSEIVHELRKHLPINKIIGTQYISEEINHNNFKK